MYPDPEELRPERWLKDGKFSTEDILDPLDYAFGFGRRICPGRHFADTALFMVVSTILHTLTIAPPVDADGNPVHLEGKMTHGLLS